MSYLPTARGVTLQENAVSAPVHLDRQRLPRVHRELILRIAPPRRLVPVDGDDPVSRPEPGLRARPLLLHDADHRGLELVRRDAHAQREDGRMERQGENEIHARSGEEDQRALPPLADGRRLRRCAFGDRRLVRPEPHDPDVPAQRDRGDPVIRAAPLLPEEALAESRRRRPRREIETPWRGRSGRTRERQRERRGRAAARACFPGWSRCLRSS